MIRILNFSKSGVSAQQRRAFTLIELLIVVAIIGILAAIAVPNFLEAQVRAKVSRALADMRTMATGIETYMIDYNEYPRTRVWEKYYMEVKKDEHLYLSTRLRPLTTPVAYLSELPEEIFPPQGGWNGKTNVVTTMTLTLKSFDTYDYFDSKSDYIDWEYWVDEGASINPATSITYALEHDADSTRGCYWRLCSPGPDLWASYGIVWTTAALVNQQTAFGAEQGFDYDSTNGTVSNGDIVFLGPRIREWNPDLAQELNRNWYKF